MRYRVILVEHDLAMLSELAGTIRTDPSFELAATYQDPEAAVGQSSVFHPNLFLVDVDIPRGLETLSTLIRLYPEAEVLGIMERWNGDLADEVLRAGALGSLLKPFQMEEVTEALSLYKRRGQRLPARTLAFFSPKGRSGQSTVASILAIELARRSNESVALIDADLQFGDLAMFFDVAPPHNVVEASHDIRLLTPESLEPYFYPLGENVWILCGAARPEHAELVEAEQLINVVRMAGSLFRYVLLDLPAGFNPISIALTEFADTNILMTMLNSGQEVHHMKRSMRMFRSWESYGKKIYSLFSRVQPCTDGQKQKIEEEFGRPVTGILPNAYQITSITSGGRLMKDLPEDMPLVRSLGNLAADFVAGRR